MSAFERLAECRGLWAMELWRASRGGNNGNAALGAATSRLELIEAAIALVESLRALGNTPARLMLLGAAYRRKACMTDGAGRRDALEQMRRAYRDAVSCDRNARGQADPCATLQWTAAELALRGQESANDTQLGEWLERLRQVESDAGENAGRRLRLWDATVAAESALLRHVVHVDLDAHANEVVDRYSEVRFRTTSPREFRLVLEPIEFLIEMTQSEVADEGRRASLVKGLQAVYNPLSFWLMRPLRPAATN